MVVSLTNLLDNEEWLKKLFSEFKCSLDSDVEFFLKNTAIEWEKTKKSRTFLYFDDKKLQQEQYEIDGFFSLALKAFYLKNEAKDLQIKKGKPFPAYLIGQLGRADGSKKGLGKHLLNLAIQSIKTAQKYVGGYFIYLDCKENMVDYYVRNGFIFVQDRDSKVNTLKQMYMLI